MFVCVEHRERERETKEEKKRQSREMYLSGAGIMCGANNGKMRSRKGSGKIDVGGRLCLI